MPARVFFSKRPLPRAGSCLGTSRSARPFTADTMIIAADNAGKTFATSIRFLSTGKSTLEKNHRSVANVGNYLGATPTSLNISKITLEKGLINVVRVEKPSVSNIVLLSTRKFTLEKGLTSEGVH